VRVLLVVHGFPPQEQSGTELYTAELAQALSRAGHDVAVFAGSHSAGGPVQDWRSDGKVEVERLARPRRRLRLQFADDSVESGLLATVNRFGPDVVHVHHLLGLTMPLVPLLKERELPVVLTLHDHWFLCPEVQPFAPGLHRLGGARYGLNCYLHLELLRPRRIASMLAGRDLVSRARVHLERARLARAELEAADILITPSRFLRARYASFGVPETRLFVIPHGIATLAEASADEGSELRVGCLAPLLHGKGIDLLVRAFRGVRNPAARLEIRGPEPDMGYARRVRRLAVHDHRISIGPSIAHDEVGSFLGALDLLVVPSRFQESFSLVAHEAFAARVPVVASDSGALPETITEGANGALFQTGSVRALRARLRELLDDPGALDKLTSFPPVKTIDAHAGELAALYRALAAGSELPQPLAR
jgi:glycosyltransferase involved in cell wall biosynthesis